MKLIKNKHRASLTDNQLLLLIRIALSKIEIDIKELVNIKFDDKI